MNDIVNASLNFVVQRLLRAYVALDQFRHYSCAP